MTFIKRKGRASFSVGKRGPRMSYRLGCAVPILAMLLIAALLAGCGGSIDQADVPPAGDIWFGTAFDPNTLAISGRTDTVSTTEVFAFVGTLPSAMDGSEVNIRIAYDGQQVSNQEANATGSGEVFGFTYGPLFEPGTWTFEMTDIGGNVLASGDVTATE